MGLQHERQFQNDHRVRNRARWSSRQVSRRLLRLLVQTFVPADAPVVIGMDDASERRRGERIAARGVYRDPVRSSRSFSMKTSGLRWRSLQLLVRIPWAERGWALPFLTVLAPSERFHQERGKRHTSRTDWGRQALLQVRRWLPERQSIVAVDSSYAVLDLLAVDARLPHPITVVTRLRLDGALSSTAPFHHDDRYLAAPQVVAHFVLRWQLEVTLHEVQAHLGVEAPQQWSARAIQRTTPALFGLFSLVTLPAHHRLQQAPPLLPTRAGYTRPLPTCVDALALVRHGLGPVQMFTTSPVPAGIVEIPGALWERLTATLAYAA
jgi:hypothetical protein